MAKPRPKKIKEKKSGGFLSRYHFPVGATYNLKPQGGSESGGTANVQLCKCAKNVFLKQREDKEEERQKAAQQALIDYAMEELNRMYGGNPPCS